MKFQAVASVVFCLATACSAGDDEPAVEGEEQGTQQGSGVDCSGATTLTSEQWDECTAPRTGTHAVDSRSCEGTPIDQQFRVEPALICRVSAGELTTRCGIGTYCRSHDECNEAPRGRCTGVASANCDYGNKNLSESCDSNAACGPGGTCSEFRLYQGELCHPTGDCAPFPERVCIYPESPCEDDGDCTAAPGGVCRKLIRHTACEYHGCLADADCGPSRRCACHRCVPSTCSGDQECGAGEGCRLGIGCWGYPSGFHCSSSADTCVTSSDCGNEPCEFNGTSWQCGQQLCPVGE